MRVRRKATYADVAATIAVVIAVGGVGAAVAAIPDSDGVISACLDRRGSIRVIDPATGGACTDRETSLSWQDGRTAAATLSRAKLARRPQRPRQPGTLDEAQGRLPRSH